MGSKPIVKPVQLLAILLIFHLIVNTIWILLNEAPPAWDEANHTRVSFEFYHSLQNLFSGNFNYQELIKPFSDPYGPLVRVITGFSLLSFGAHIKLAQFVATGFFLLTILMVYLLGKKIFKNEWGGLIGAFIFSFYQILYDNSRWLLLDIPTVFFILLALYFLFRSNFFESKKYTLLTFFILSLVGLTKLQGLIYFLFPFLYAFFLLVKDKSRQKMHNITLGGFIFLSVISLWVIPSFNNLVKYYSVAVRAEPISDPTSLLDPTTWFHYLKLFVNFEITPFVFIFFVIFLYFFVRSTTAHKSFVLLFIVANYLLFTLFPNKDMRYLFPILPFTTLVFASGFIKFYKFNKTLAKLSLLVVVIYNLIFYFSLSFGFPLEKGLRKQLEFPFIKDIIYLNLTDYPVRILDRWSWPNEKIINDLATFDNRPKKVLLAVDSERINNSNLALYITKNKVPNLIFNTPFEIVEFSEGSLRSHVEQYDYIAITNPDINPFYLFHKKALGQIVGYVKKSRMKPLLFYKLPTGEDMLVFPTEK